jgi:hypothetical protein
MRLSFHPLVQRDINSILRRYDFVSRELGDQFFQELTAALILFCELPKGSSG